MIFRKGITIIVGLLFMLLISCTKETKDPPSGFIQLVSAIMSNVSLLDEMPIVQKDANIALSFSVSIDPASSQLISLESDAGGTVEIDIQSLDNNKLINIDPIEDLETDQTYSLIIPQDIKGVNNESFAGVTLNFQTEKSTLILNSVTVNGIELKKSGRNLELPLEPIFKISFSDEVSKSVLEDEIVLVGRQNYNFIIDEKELGMYELSPTEALEGFSKINLLFPSSIGSETNRNFETESYELFTTLDTIPKFPIISDEELLTLVQSQTFKYFWDFGHPVSGLARERNTSNNIVTSGGSGFGIMSMIVGVERGFITRNEAIERWQKIFDFLEEADRFHGAWPHWINGNTGNVQPFSEKDNGGDLVETAFLIQGMLTVRQYLDAEDEIEAALISQINRLWESVEWDWYRKGGENVLYWHWSPQYLWDINLKIRGHNETQIIYILAASSPTHSIPKEVYTVGYANSGNFENGNTYYDHILPLGPSRGGPLFFSHYSYLGLDPRNLEDQYAEYWVQNVSHSLINHAYCIDNPKNYVGYSDKCWGLTASDGDSGYSAHSPNNDKGVITPTAAISSIPYTPDESMAAIKHFYYQLGDRLWGEYGFYDAFNPTANWVANSFLAIDQGPIIVMIENYRTGLLWDLFMSAPEVKSGLDKLGFVY